MKKRNGVNWSMTIPAKSRRQRVLPRLQNQLKAGVKPSKENPGEMIPLTEKDIKRINKEVETLKSRT